MIHFNILTLFPEFIENFFKFSILKKAEEKGLVKHRLINFREFSEDKHKTVDDTPFGGGYGMVLKPEPIVNALSSLTKEERGKVLLLSAKGKLFNQKMAKNLAKEKNITLICGRYEGIDERVNYFVDEEVSIGNFVLMGGESAACVIIESVARLYPGVVGKEGSIEEESFSTNFLEYPQYTRPRDFKKCQAPEILVSGNHGEIEKWRKKQQIKITVKNRFDLIKNRDFPLNKEEVKLVKKYLTEKEIYIALLHYPVYNKNQEIVATATTNMDIHDISRVAKTYNIKKYFIVTPIEEQKQYIQRIVKHWKEGYGLQYNDNRAKALSIVDIIDNFENCVNEIKKKTDKNLLVIGTSAQYKKDKVITFNKITEILDNNAVLLVFGTGWGLTEEIIEKFDYMLESIYGLGNFNHLSVRSAISIILDRILGF